MQEIDGRVQLGDQLGDRVLSEKKFPIKKLLV
jgi:hypothetical protein